MELPNNKTQSVNHANKPQFIMKNVLNLFIKIIFLFSFILIKAQNEPINDYLETLNLKENEKIMIIREKINNNNTIEIFKGKTYYDTKRKEYLNYIEGWNPIYDKKDWIQMKKIYEEDFITDYWIKGNYWTLSDFKHKNILFWEQEKLPNPGKYEKFDFEDDFRIFTFSSPIYYKKKMYALFSFRTTTTRHLVLGESGPNQIIIMKKVKDKWIFINGLFDGIYN
jgi:hypothetical protein